MCPKFKSIKVKYHKIINLESKRLDNMKRVLALHPTPFPYSTSKRSVKTGL